ncbi:hypothetical protein PM082_008095 [Marasmius tenuissimus]|nr:hypothetical protein PM082_008095 [Marasmius tenuissimus]
MQLPPQNTIESKAAIIWNRSRSLMSSVTNYHRETVIITIQPTPTDIITLNFLKRPRYVLTRLYFMAGWTYAQERNHADIISDVHHDHHEQQGTIYTTWSRQLFCAVLLSNHWEVLVNPATQIPDFLFEVEADALDGGLLPLAARPISRGVRILKPSTPQGFGLPDLMMHGDVSPLPVVWARLFGLMRSSNLSEANAGWTTQKRSTLCRVLLWNCPDTMYNVLGFMNIVARASADPRLWGHR